MDLPVTQLVRPLANDLPPGYDPLGTTARQSVLITRLTMLRWQARGKLSSVVEGYRAHALDAIDCASPRLVREPVGQKSSSSEHADAHEWRLPVAGLTGRSAPL